MSEIEELRERVRELEGGRDNFANLYSEGLAWVTRCRKEHDRANRAEATVASLKEQVEAMRGALTLAANRLHRRAIDFVPGTATFIETCEWADEARAALTTENQTNE